MTSRMHYLVSRMINSIALFCYPNSRTESESANRNYEAQLKFQLNNTYLLSALFQNTQLKYTILSISNTILKTDNNYQNSNSFLFYFAVSFSPSTLSTSYFYFPPHFQVRVVRAQDFSRLNERDQRNCRQYIN